MVFVGLLYFVSSSPDHIDVQAELRITNVEEQYFLVGSTDHCNHW